jgi:hypothetical protein
LVAVSWKDDGELSIAGHASNIDFYQAECKDNSQFRGFLMEEMFNYRGVPESF